MIQTYARDKKFKYFIRAACALPFIKVNELEAAIDELREYDFDNSSPYYKDACQFRDSFLDYIEEVWIK